MLQLRADDRNSSALCGLPLIHDSREDGLDQPVAATIRKAKGVRVCLTGSVEDFAAESRTALMQPHLDRFRASAS